MYLKGGRRFAPAPPKSTPIMTNLNEISILAVAHADEDGEHLLEVGIKLRLDISCKLHQEIQQRLIGQTVLDQQTILQLGKNFILRGYERM